MCGIAGIVSPARQQALGESGYLALVARMADRLRHRGPDAGGVWVDRATAVAFGHRRLSILDLSAAGAQPMQSAAGTWVVCYNGELYNHPELRQELRRHGMTFRGQSDTEVLANALEQWGVEKSLRRFSGMFAFAALDIRRRRLYLARDRLGEKPLYYGTTRDAFVFASELKAIVAATESPLDLDRDAVTLFLRHNYIPAPYSIYRGIRKLEPGHFVTIDVGGSGGSRIDTNRRYWDFADGSPAPGHADESGEVGPLEMLLERSVRRQLVADVPVGAFLSGGVDSSTIVALASEVSSEPVRTFTIGFEQAEFDEARHAERIAAHLGTRHTTFRVTPDDARQVIPLLPEMYDEPFGDSSQIPTYLVSRLTRSEVTVALSGDGGDELFGGYQRYAVAERLWSRLEGIPCGVRRVIPGALGGLPGGVLATVARILNRVSPRPEGDFTESRLRRLCELARCCDRDTLYRGLVSHELHPERWVRGGCEPDYAFSRPETRADEFLGQMMARDISTYLPDDILAKVDRASMAVSLEVRVPLLDHELVEYTWRQRPRQIETGTNTTKASLREILYRRVPRELIERPKSGFAVPLGDWLRGPLQTWVRDLLAPESLRRQGLIDDAAVAGLLREHYQGGGDHRYRLWNLLMLQAWLQRTATGAGDE